MADDENDSNKIKKGSSLNRTFVCGVVGAGIGLLSSPKTNKKVFNRMAQSEVVRGVGRELGSAAREMITQQALNSLKRSTVIFLNRNENDLIDKKKRKSTGGNAGDHSSEMAALKEENRKMSEQLQLLEQKINEDKEMNNMSNSESY